jgi:hypothetical protein
VEVREEIKQSKYKNDEWLGLSTKDSKGSMFWNEIVII